MNIEKHNGMKQALMNVVGPEHVSDSAAVMEAYTRDFLPPGILEYRPPEFVVLPGGTSDVQAVYKLANRYKFHCIPVGSNFWSIVTKPNRPHTLIVDPKRMNRIVEIDAKNMYAIIEPYVSNAQVAAEAMKHGLIAGTPEAGAQASHLAGHTFQSVWGIGYRTGIGHRNILGYEWVLPTGELLRIGALSQPHAGWSWGEGPGPDLRGMLRAFVGVVGGLGMVTRMAVKLHPWPGPKIFSCEGCTPNQKSVLPREKFEWILFRYRTLEDCVKVLYEISRCEIGGNLQKWPVSYLNWWWAKSNQEYWETWKSGYFQKNMKNMIAVCLWAFTSEKQLHYEKRVLMDIIEETGGTLVPQECYDKWVPFTANNWIRDTSGPRMMLPSGGFGAFTLGIDTITFACESIKRGQSFIDRYSPPVLDCDYPDWISVYDMGHFAIGEVDFPFEKTPEQCQALMAALMDFIQWDLAHRTEDGLGPAVGGLYHAMAGRVYGYDKLLSGIKKRLDPANVANPPHPFPVEEVNPDKKRGRS